MARRARSRATSPLGIAAADAAATEALAAIDERVSTQLAALAALGSLVDACERATPGGVLARQAKRLLDERRGAMRSYHLERALRAVDRVALAGDVARAEAVQIVRDAISVTTAIDGESGEVRGLRVRLLDLERGGHGEARPFFARYLTRQTRG